MNGLETQWFAHCGDLGDIIYSLPTIRCAGGGTLFLYNQPGKTTHAMTEQRVSLLKPLLCMQEYVKDVVWCAEGHEDSSINGFRHHHRPGRNLADMHLATHGFNWNERTTAWLKVDKPERVAPAIFCRTSRYQNTRFPWSRIWSKYKDKAVFLGTEMEHRQFCDEVGFIPYHPTVDLLQAARIISGSSLCISNQSVLHAIAEGLKHNVIMEVCPYCNNCSFERLNRVNGWDDNIELPDIT